jgi:DNA polymerase III delta prime subunit
MQKIIQKHEILPIHENVQQKLDFFYESNKIPHILFHGSPGTGKRTIVYHFINRIYKYNKQIIKNNVMLINCAHGKGIKFIREELKFFAKSNIKQTDETILFKTIVLLNADYLTIDAQSALRRCIELFSHNTRFFIIVGNKNKLLNPILSRFCEIYIPVYMDENNKPIHLHQYSLKKQYNIDLIQQKKTDYIHSLIGGDNNDNDKIKTVEELADMAIQLYEKGLSCLDVIHWMDTITFITDKEKSVIHVYFHKIKSEFRCEKLLLFYMLHYIFNKEEKNLNIMNEIIT